MPDCTQHKISGNESGLLIESGQTGREGMDWVVGLQNAVNYIEDHLTEDIDYEAVAAQSFSSTNHFQGAQFGLETRTASRRRSRNSTAYCRPRSGTVTVSSSPFPALY